jgi:hypothetical protein
MMIVTLNTPLKICILNQNVPFLTTETLRVSIRKMQQMFLAEMK